MNSYKIWEYLEQHMDSISNAGKVTLMIHAKAIQDLIQPEACSCKGCRWEGDCGITIPSRSTSPTDHTCYESTLCTLKDKYECEHDTQPEEVAIECNPILDIKPSHSESHPMHIIKTSVAKPTCTLKTKYECEHGQQVTTNWTCEVCGQPRCGKHECKPTSQLDVAINNFEQAFKGKDVNRPEEGGTTNEI